ncbi:response regulator transcription factor [Silvibacterium dinghuense]|uniref:Response regulator transcription factor n=1 Tax=Silvibacterium dinghuense TaxID=1560006 RepID=A0A4Q1SEX1_9BACT|nr:response regulator transcription factor [Silvibacterium dinghuense]RXS95673.1 response regulator transcription factor [Silvibacterium dinghuense]GGH14851.1 DNA-binding response regulator [Silvibacterium dinghuense]
MRLLVVDGDQALAALLQRSFAGEGHSVVVACDGQEAVDQFHTVAPDLTILDLNLPRRDGLEVLKLLRASGEDAPVLVLSARSALEVRVQVLELGADDFLAKPFAMSELRARCRAVVRRRGAAAMVLRQRGLEVNRVERSVLCEGRAVTLTNKEFALLEYLLLNRGQAVSRATLLEHVWELRASTTNVVDVYVNYLRRKLGDTGQPALIETVRGQGYAIGLAQ